MSKNKLTFHEKSRINQRKMYAEYLSEISKNPNINKSELKRKLAADYGYMSENSVNTIIWKIEKTTKS